MQDPAATRVSAASDPPLLSWPAAERPRERLKAQGPRALSDAELLALLLGSGGPGGVLALARRVLARAQSLGGLRRLRAADLAGIPGLGEAKSAGILAALELGRRSAAAPAPEGRLMDAAMAAAALRPLLQDLAEEHVAVLALDARRRILAAERVSQGSLTMALAHPREVFRSAIKLGAAAVVLGHNHPSGDPEPSPDDRALTRRLLQAAEILALPLLDHIVVGEPGHYSFAENGWS